MNIYPVGQDRPQQPVERLEAEAVNSGQLDSTYVQSSSLGPPVTVDASRSHDASMVSELNLSMFNIPDPGGRPVNHLINANNTSNNSSIFDISQ